MGNVQNKLNQKRKDLVGPTLPKEIRNVWSSHRGSNFPTVWGRSGETVRDAKEFSELTSELSTGSRYPRKPQGKPAGYRPPRGSTTGSGQQGYQKPVFSNADAPCTGRRKTPDTE